MEKKNFAERMLSLTLEVIHLLAGEEYIVVRKSRDHLKSSSRPSASSSWSRTQDPIMDPPPLSLAPETKNIKKILQVSNNIIHLLTGEVLGCLEDCEDLCEDVVIIEQQPSALLDIAKRKNKLEERHVQVAVPDVQEESEGINQSQRGYKLLPQHGGSKLSQRSNSQQEDLSPDNSQFQDHQLRPSAEDHEEIEFAMVHIKEEQELEPWEVLEEDKADTSGPEDNPACQDYENGPMGVDCTDANSQPLLGIGIEGFFSPFSSTSSPTIPNTKTYKCPECPEVFSCHSELFKHQSHHRGSPLFACPLCRKNFTSKSNLAKHQKIHTGEKPFSCSECGKSFREKHYLASHQAVHRGAQLIVCPQCGKGYTSKSNLAKHQRTHTGQKPFGCSICSKSFNQRSVLLAHQRTHTGEKPFSCDLCARRFTDNLQLVRHQATHSEEKTFCCNECGKSFTRKDLLLKHLAAHTEDELDSSKTVT